MGEGDLLTKGRLAHGKGSVLENFMRRHSTTKLINF